MKEEFNFEEIKNKALEQLKSGKSLLSKDGAFAPLLESILNAALEKLVYLAYRNIRKKWTMPLANWGKTAQQLAILYRDRFK